MVATCETRAGRTGAARGAELAFRAEAIGFRLLGRAADVRGACDDSAALARRVELMRRAGVWFGRRDRLDALAAD